MAATPSPPFDPFSPLDRQSFSYETVVKRWPVILTGIIDDVHKAVGNLYPPISPRDSGAASPSGNESPASSSPKIKEGKEILAELSQLKYEMARDRILPRVPDDGGLDVDEYNAELERLESIQKRTWFTAPWLFAECYLYRLVRAWFQRSKYWNQHDPFYQQKISTFKASGAAIFRLATTMSEMESKKSELLSDATEARQKLHVLFDEMIQMCLWGNATDLSLLPTMSYADIQKLQSLQSVGSSQSSEGSAFILRNDLEAAWKRVSSLKKEDSRVSKIDIVLDNSGFELFTDLVLADFLVTYTPFVSKVVFHPKLIPWFVSDVLPPDFRFILSPTPPEDLAPTWTEFFSSESGEASAPNAGTDLETMLARWRSYVADGTFALSVPFDSPIGVPGKDASEAVKDAAFWTGWKSYWALPEQDGLMKSLKESGLVIFKGDLNYRKLTADVKWPPTTPVPEALGPLSGTCSLLSLRTCKADVVVGLEPGTAERLDASEDDSVRKWRINGKYAVITYDGA